MAGKNDVDIQIRAKDAVGPGVDSARRSIAQFGRDAERATGGSATDAAIKFGAAINGIRGAVDLAAAGVQLLRGNMEGVGEALKRLPLGIGGVIGSIQELNEALTTTETATTRADKRLNDFVSQRMRLESNLNLIGANPLEVELGKLDEERRKANDAAFAARAKAFQDNKTQNNQAYKDEVEQIDRILAVQLEGIRRREQLAREAVDRRTAEAKREREMFNKLQDEFLREELRIERQRREQLQSESRIFQIGGQSNLDAVIRGLASEGLVSADIEAIDERIRQLRRGQNGPGLPAGESSRFTTGVVESATDRLASENAKQTKLLEEQLKKLEEMKELLKNQKPIEFDSGIFGGGGA